MLERAARESDDEALGTIPDVLNVARNMLSKDPMLRPTARDVRDGLFEILRCTSIPSVHCGAHRHDIGIASSSHSSRDRASSIVSLQTVSTTSSRYSDTDTIRSGTTQVHSILNYYSDRSTLSGIQEDDSASLETIEPPPLPHNTDKLNETFGGAAVIPESPTLSELPRSPTSPISPMSPIFDRSTSPSRLNAPTTKAKSWSKPFLLLP